MSNSSKEIISSDQVDENFYGQIETIVKLEMVAQNNILEYRENLEENGSKLEEIQQMLDTIRGEVTLNSVLPKMNVLLQQDVEQFKTLALKIYERLESFVPKLEYAEKLHSSIKYDNQKLQEMKQILSQKVNDAILNEKTLLLNQSKSEAEENAKINNLVQLINECEANIEKIKKNIHFEESNTEIIENQNVDLIGKLEKLTEMIDEKEKAILDLKNNSTITSNDADNSFNENRNFTMNQEISEILEKVNDIKNKVEESQGLLDESISKLHDKQNLSKEVYKKKSVHTLNQVQFLLNEKLINEYKQFEDKINNLQKSLANSQLELKSWEDDENKISEDLKNEELTIELINSKKQSLTEKEIFLIDSIDKIEKQIESLQNANKNEENDLNEHADLLKEKEIQEKHSLELQKEIDDLNEKIMKAKEMKNLENFSLDDIRKQNKELKRKYSNYLRAYTNLKTEEGKCEGDTSDTSFF